MPAVAGPALGIEPVCGVVAVVTAYAVGPASVAISAAPAAARATLRERRPTTARVRPESTPRITTTHFSHGR